MTNTKAHNKALYMVEEWLYKAAMYYAVGNVDMYDFCSRVAVHFRNMSARFI